MPDPQPTADAEPAIGVRGLRAFLADRENLVFALMLGALLVPIWSVTYFPSQDGPSHLHNADVLRSYFRPEASHFREYYQLDPRPLPNLLGHLALAGLMSMLPALVAQKALLSGYVLLLPIAARYAFGAAGPQGRSLSFLVFPFIYGYFLHAGFFNFCYSIAIFLFVVGYWLRHREQMTAHRALILGLLGLLLYFAHLLSLILAVGAIGILSLTLCFADRWRWHGAASRLLLPLAAMLPALILAAAFVAQTRQVNTGGGKEYIPIGRLVSDLVRNESMVSFRDKERLPAAGMTALMAVMVAMALAGPRHGRGMPALLLVIAAYVVLYLRARDARAVGLVLPARLNLYIMLSLLLWLAFQQYRPAAVRIAQVAALAITMALLTSHIHKYRQLNGYLREYCSAADHMAPGSNFLPLSFAHAGRDPAGRPLSIDAEPFRHAGGYIAVARGAVDLSNYEAATPFFPVRLRPGLDPFIHIGPDYGIERRPPVVDFLTYPQRTGGRIDYVLLWGLSEDVLQDPATQSIFRQLREGHYRRILVSPNRLVELYQRQPPRSARE